MRTCPPSLVLIASLAATLGAVSHTRTAAAELAGATETIDAAEYPTLQAALDAVPKEGGSVRLPPGRFEFDGPLRVGTTDTLIVGAGSATHLVNTNRNGEPAILLEQGEYPDRAAPRDQRLWRVELAQIRITGNDQSGAGIEARHINELFLHDLTVSHHGAHGVVLDHCYENPRLIGNQITYNAADGVHLSGAHDIVVSANQLEENQTGLRCIDGFNLTMTGNNLDDHLGDGVVIENTYGSVLSGNMIEECQGWAIILDRNCYGITLSANVIAHDFAGGIDLRDAHGCAITGNTFTIVKNAAIAVREGAGRIVVTGNAFSDSYRGKDTQRGSEATKLEENPNEATGLLLETDAPVVLVGNLFSGLTTPPVRGDAELDLEKGSNMVVENE